MTRKQAKPAPRPKQEPKAKPAHEREREIILSALQERPEIAAADLRELTGMNRKVFNRLVNAMEEVERLGTSRGSRYRLRRNDAAAE